MRQVIITYCVICKNHRIACYDSDRKEKKKYCVDPFTGKSCMEICPPPSQPHSHSLCDEHKTAWLKQIRDKEK